MEKRRAAVCLMLLGLLICMAPRLTHAQFSTPFPVNTASVNDTAADNEPMIVAGANGTWLAIWVSQSSLFLDPNASDPVGTGNNVNEDIVYSRSVDNGQTWSPIARIRTDAANDKADDIDPQVATDGQGHWMVVWRSKDPLGGTIGYDYDILMSYSADNGLTWTPPAPVNKYANSDPGGWNAISDYCDDIRPHVYADDKGHWIVGWVAFDNQTGSGWQNSVLIAVSSNAGKNWSAPITLHTHNESNQTGVQEPRLNYDGKGRWIATWASRPNSTSNVRLNYSISDDYGQTWSAAAMMIPSQAGSIGDNFNPWLATDGKGQWVMTWTSSDTLSGTIGTDWDVLYARSSDNGLTWSAPTVVNTDAATDGINDTSTQVIYDGRGNWIASWMNNKRSGDNNCYYAVLGAGKSTWTAPQPLNPWANSDPGKYYDGQSSLSSDLQGHWMAIWASTYNFAGTNPNNDFDIYGIYCSATPPVDPTLSASPGSLNFRKGSGFEVDIINHTPPTTQDLVVSNLGLTPLVISNLRFTLPYAADFSVTSPTTLPLTIPPFENRNVTVRFAPQETTITLDMKAALEITSNDPQQPTFAIPMSGDAVPVDLSHFKAE